MPAAIAGSSGTVFSILHLRSRSHPQTALAAEFMGIGQCAEGSRLVAKEAAVVLPGDDEGSVGVGDLGGSELHDHSPVVSLLTKERYAKMARLSRK